MNKTIKMLGEVYKIVEKDLDISNDPGQMGLIDYMKQEIFINNGMSETAKMKTLLHEITHFIDYEIGIGLSEENVNRFSSVFFHILYDNGYLKI